MMILESERLQVTTITDEQLAVIAAIYSDAEVMRYVYQGVPLTYAETAGRMQKRQEAARQSGRGLGMFAVIYKVNNMVIGSCGIIPAQDVLLYGEFELSITLSKDVWGEKLGSELLTALIAYGLLKVGLPRLIGCVHPNNAVSLAIIRKAGMTFERQILLTRGERLLFSIERLSDHATQSL